MATRIYGRSRSLGPTVAARAAKALIACGPGDSITVDSFYMQGGWRRFLLPLLDAVRPIEFVGRWQSTGSCEAVDDYGITAWGAGATKALPAHGWAGEYFRFGHPSLHLVYCGTNGLESSSMVSVIVDPILAADSAVKILIAPLFPRQSVDHSAFNAAIIAAVEGHSSFGTRVFLARSMATALTLADLRDGIHPTPSGYEKMAQCWANEIAAQGLI